MARCKQITGLLAVFLIRIDNFATVTFSKYLLKIATLNDYFTYINKYI